MLTDEALYSYSRLFTVAATVFTANAQGELTTMTIQARNDLNRNLGLIVLAYAYVIPIGILVKTFFGG